MMIIYIKKNVELKDKKTRTRKHQMDINFQWLILFTNDICLHN